MIDQLIAVSAVFLLAGLVKGAIGLGLPTVSMGLMGVWMPLADAAAILVLPAVLTNVWQTLDGPYLARIWRRLWPMMAALAVCAVIGAAVITGARTALTVSLLGGVLIAFATLGLTGFRFNVPARAEAALGPAMGAATGLITGSTAIFVIPSVPYIQSLDLDKTEFTQAFGLTALTASTGLALGLGVHGGFAPSQAMLPGVAATLTAFAGMAVGRIVRNRLPVETFRHCVLAALMALGGSMIVRALI